MSPNSIHEVARQRTGQCRSGGEDGAERTRVVASERVVRELDDPVEHRRNERRGRDVVLVDRRQESLRLEFIHDHRGIAEDLGEREEAKRGRVIERARDAMNVVDAHRRLVDEPHRGGHRILREFADGALRLARRPGGIDDDGRVLVEVLPLRARASGESRSPSSSLPTTKTFLRKSGERFGFASSSDRASARDRSRCLVRRSDSRGRSARRRWSARRSRPTPRRGDPRRRRAPRTRGDSSSSG